MHVGMVAGTRDGSHVPATPYLFVGLVRCNGWSLGQIKILAVLAGTPDGGVSRGEQNNFGPLVFHVIHLPSAAEDKLNAGAPETWGAPVVAYSSAS